MVIKRWKILIQNVTKEASKASKTFMVFKNGIAFSVFDAQNTPLSFRMKNMSNNQSKLIVKKIRKK